MDRSVYTENNCSVVVFNRSVVGVLDHINALALLDSALNNNFIKFQLNFHAITNCTFCIKHVNVHGKFAQETYISILHIVASDPKKYKFIQAMAEYPDKLLQILNYQDSDGRTPLMYAVVNQALNTVQELILRKANVDIIDNDGFTAIAMVVKSHNKLMFKYLLNAGYNQHIKCNAVLPYLYSVAEDGYWYLAQLGAAGANVWLLNNDLLSPIHYALQKGYVKNVASLLKFTTNISKKITTKTLIESLIQADNYGILPMLLFWQHQYVNNILKIAPILTPPKPCIFSCKKRAQIAPDNIDTGIKYNSLRLIAEFADEEEAVVVEKLHIVSEVYIDKKMITRLLAVPKIRRAIPGSHLV